MALKSYARHAHKYHRSDAGMLTGFKQLWTLFNRTEKRRFVLLFCLILSLAFVELLGVSSLVPFLAVAADPELVETNRYLSYVYTTLGFTTRESFLVLLGSAVAGFIILRNVFTALVKYAKSRFSHMRGHAMSYRLLGKYLSQPYVFFLDENSANLAKNVLGEVKRVVTGYLQPLLELVTDTVVVFSIAIVLIVVDPWVALAVVAIVGGLYGGIYLVVRHRLSALGKKRLKANRERYTTTMEAMAGIKDVKLLGKERFFLERFAKPSLRMARAVTRIDVIGKIPRYISDATINAGIVVAITAMLALGGDVGRYIPVLGLYVLAGKRLLPKVQNLYVQISKLRAYQPVVEMMFAHLKDGADTIVPQLSALDIEPLPFERELSLQNITFTYPGAESPVVKISSITIGRNTTVGIVGPTGCGKTTLVDIVLGLLKPEAGRLLVDDTEITAENLRRWQANLGYVPQSIYLSDDTVTRNIAFGIPDERIDREKVRRAARIANISEFIENELPQGYDTVTGERGLRLSGGQRQRLGIARALYTDPDILVMDEATSALDGMTEAAIMEAMENLMGKKTIILIAHRLATLKDADAIFMIDKGRIVASGTYDSLIAENRHFRRMARVSEQ